MSKYHKISLDDFKQFLEFIDNFYAKEQNLRYLSGLKKIKWSLSEEEIIINASKRVLQFLFFDNTTILKAKSSNSIRHNFPKSLIKANKSRELFIKLKEIFKLIDIDIKTVKPEISKNPSYFYFKNYKSIFKFLLYWDNSWIKFPEDYLESLKEFINSFEVFVNFDNKFINSIFGESGLIKKSKVPITKFFKYIINYANRERESKYQRHAIYKWRDDKFLPVNVLYDLIKSEYSKDFDTEFFKYIKSIKIGRSKKDNDIEKNLLIEIKTHNKDILNEVIPISTTNLGWLLNYPFEIKKRYFDILSEYKKIIEKYPSEIKDQYKEIINSIKNYLKPSGQLIHIKSLKLINFKSYDHEVIDFDNCINIIYGLNGSGKTTIIEAILFGFFTLTAPGGNAINELSLIQVGKKSTKVELELKIDNNIVKIERIVKRNGDQIVRINDEKLESNIIDLIITTDNGTIKFDHDYEMDKIIRELYKKHKCYLKKEDIYLSLFFEYSNIQYELTQIEWEELEQRRPKKPLGYVEDTPFFREKEYIYQELNYSYQRLLNLDFDYFIEPIRDKMKQDNRFSKTVVFPLAKENLYNSINQNFFFAITIDKDICDSHNDIIYKPGVICSQCYNKYCINCTHSLFDCPNCGGSLIKDLVDYKRREFQVNDFKKIFNNFAEFNKKDIEIDKFQPYPSKITQELKFDYDPKNLQKLKLCIENPYLDYLFDFLEVLINKNSRKFNIILNIDKIVEFNQNSNDANIFAKNIDLKLDSQKEIESLNQNLIILKIFNFFSLILTINFIKIQKSFYIIDDDKYNSQNINKLQNIMKKIHSDISYVLEDEKKFNQIILLGLPFERKLLEFINTIYLIFQSKLIPSEIIESYKKSKEFEFIKILNKAIISNFKEIRGAREINININVEGMNRGYTINFESYILKFPHKKDYEIFKFQLKNQLNLFFNIEIINNIHERYNRYRKQISFIGEVENSLYKKCMEYIRRSFEEQSKIIFNGENFKCFLDKYGVPRIEFHGSSEIHPISRLSGGEKNKILMLLQCNLIGLPKHSAFYLIDEPNEILDPINIDIMKEYFFQLFYDKQVVICTFIDKYRDFKPALIYEVWKDNTNVSHIFQLPNDLEKYDKFKKLDKFNEKIEQNPNDYYYYRVKMVLLVDLNLFDNAIKTIEKAEENNIEKEKFAVLKENLLNLNELYEDLRSNSNRVEFYKLKSASLYDFQGYHEALENINKTIELNSEIPELYAFKASILMFLKKHNNALKTIKILEEKFPQINNFYRLKSQLYEHVGDNERALSEINKSIDGGDVDEWNYYQKAKILYTMEKFNEALNNLNKAIELSPHEHVYIQDKINILESLNRVDDAIDLLKKEKEYYPQAEQIEAQLYQTKAYNLMKSGKKEGAIQEIKKAIELEPDEADFYHTYGQILMMFNDFKGAIKQLETAKKLYFTPIETYIKLGKCYYELEQYEKAVENLEIGKNQAQHSVKKIVLTEDDKRIQEDFPQTELIEEAEKYLSKINTRK